MKRRTFLAALAVAPLCEPPTAPPVSRAPRPQPAPSYTATSRKTGSSMLIVFDGETLKWSVTHLGVYVPPF